MTKRGRPKVSAEKLRADVRAYCERYGVAPAASGLPPFPAGLRETKQHKDWLRAYRAHRRLVVDAMQSAAGVMAFRALLT